MFTSGSVVAEQDHLHALQAEHPVGLRPAAVVADAHPEDPVKGAPHRKPEIADLEVALFEMLERRFGKVVRVSGEMDLPVFRKDLTAVHQDRGVEATDAVRLPDEFGVAEVEADAEPPGGVKEGLGFRPGHHGFEVGVGGGCVLEEITREEGSEGEFREHHEPAAPRRCPFHEGEQPLNHLAS